ncbi:MAG: hypothetical protein JRN68_00415 [Nitrososphaerota archaeon]|nr:hypothetical protein [Nitrososphaerota archaeon]
MSGSSIKDDAELLLAEEQGVLNRKVGAKYALEEVFHVGRDAQGTLLLTSRRIVFLIGNRQEDLPEFQGRRGKSIVYSDIEGGIPKEGLDIDVPLGSLVKIEGVRGGIENPRLIVVWKGEDGKTNQTEFVQEITGSRKKNLNDWAEAILKLKSGEIKPVALPDEPPLSTLKGKIFSVLGDMQEKGLFTIEDEVETAFGLDLSPDDVESACNELVAEGLVEKVSLKDGGTYYKRKSPLGDYDLSS